MKNNLTIFFVFLGFCFIKISGQNTFKTGSGHISFPGDLVYEGVERDMEGGNVWAKGYAAIEEDSISFTKVTFISDKSIAYYCYRYVACIKDVYILDDSVETLNDPNMERYVHLLSAMGKPKDNKRMQAVCCREYSRNNSGVVRKYQDYSLLFVYSDRKAAEAFYQRLLTVVGKGKE